MAERAFGNKPAKTPVPAATSQITTCLLPGGIALTARERNKVNSTNQITKNNAKNRKSSVINSGVPKMTVTTPAVTTDATNALFGVGSINMPSSVCRVLILLKNELGAWSCPVQNLAQDRGLRFLDVSSGSDRATADSGSACVSHAVFGVPPNTFRPGFSLKAARPKLSP